MSLERDLYPKGCKILFPEGDTCTLMCGCKVAFGGHIMSQRHLADGGLECEVIPDSTKGVIYAACPFHTSQEATRDV